MKDFNPLETPQYKATCRIRGCGMSITGTLQQCANWANNMILVYGSDDENILIEINKVDDDGKNR